MRWSDIRDGLVSVKQSKTGKALVIPVHRDLAAVLVATPRTAVTILTTKAGTPWQSGFKASWSKELTRIGWPDGLVFHGLRKSAVCFMLEAGCSTAEVSAVTGQTLVMVEHYAKQVRQGGLAASAVLKWEGKT
jgi:integrase